MTRFLLLIFFFCVTGFAKDPLLVGKEVEVLPKYLVNLIPYFDLSSLPLTNIPKDYLANRAKYGNRFDVEVAREMVTASSDLKLRADCPEDVRKLLSTMDWSMDSGALEFRDTKPTANLEEYVAHTKAFIKLVKMEELVDKPMQNLGKTRFHFHLSVLNGRDHRQLAERINALAVLKFIEGGEGELALTDPYGYLGVDEKGLLKLHSKERIEIRNHFISPEGDVRELYRLLSQPEDVSRRELAVEIRKRLTPEAIALLAKHRAEGLVLMLEQTNRDLPVKIEIDSPAIVAALEKAALEPEAQLIHLRNLLKLLSDRGDKRSRAIAEKIALRLQDVALADPESFFQRSGIYYGDLLARVHDILPSDKRKYAMNEGRWVSPLRESDKISAGYSLADLCVHSSAARRVAVGRFADRTFAGRVISQLPLEAMLDPQFRGEVLSASRGISRLSYHEFLDHAYEHRHRLTKEFLPFLERGITERHVTAVEIKEYLEAHPTPGVCGFLRDL